VAVVCAQVEPVVKTEYDEVWDWRLENENKPIWTRNPKDVSNEAYNEFFKVRLDTQPVHRSPSPSVARSQGRALCRHMCITAAVRVV
jgi:hypothetical protein